MAITGNKLINAQEPGGELGLKSAVIHHWEGANCFYASGFATDVTATGANAFAGVVKDEVDNSGGVAGDETINRYTTGTFERIGAGFTDADAGKLVYAVDNWTVSLTSTNNSLMGRISEVISATKVMVSLDVIQA